MEKSILIIDDEKLQVEGLLRILPKKVEHAHFIGAYQEEDILRKVSEKFYNLAIIDLRMDNYLFDGIELVEKIILENPFSKIIIVSAFLGEFNSKLNPLLKTGRIIAVSSKERIEKWTDELASLINDYYDDLSQQSGEISFTLEGIYSRAKNEEDTYKKGKLFEQFVVTLLSIVGFKEIRTRVIDKSKNEVDLLVRNEINDSFLNKFGKYILVECKNYPNKGVGKNDFIQFYTKLENTNGLAELGIVFTSGYIAKTTYIEAVRTSMKKCKILFISNLEIKRLIYASNIREELKLIIDEQVKDN